MTSEKQNTADSYHNFSEFYDLYVGDFLDDLPMYEKYAGQVGGPVLEIGAWSGRLTIPLAQTGFDVAAMDVSATMLAILDDRLKGLPSVVKNRAQIIQADVCELDLGAKFGLVMVPYYVFNYLLTPEAQSQALDRIKAHLADSGLVIVDAFIPMKRLASSVERQIRRPDVVNWLLETVSEGGTPFDSIPRAAWSTGSNASRSSLRTENCGSRSSQWSVGTHWLTIWNGSSCLTGSKCHRCLLDT